VWFLLKVNFIKLIYAFWGNSSLPVCMALTSCPIAQGTFLLEDEMVIELGAALRYTRSGIKTA
jgi:hypothetical protein